MDVLGGGVGHHWMGTKKEQSPLQPDGEVPKPFAAQMDRAEQAKSQDSRRYLLSIGFNWTVAPTPKDPLLSLSSQSSEVLSPFSDVFCLSIVEKAGECEPWC